MQIPRDCKIEAACSKDETRPNLTHVYLDGDRAVATDGHMMAIVPVTRDEHDADGYVTAEALAAARKAHKRMGDPIVLANGSLAVPCGPTFPRPDREEVGPFPDWRQVVPKMKDRPTSRFAGVCDRAADKLRNMKARGRFVPSGWDYNGARKGKFRNMRHLPACVRGWISDRMNGEGARIGVDLDLLTRAGKAIGTTGVVLQIPADGLAPIVVRGKSDAVAIVMPMRM